LIKYVFDIKRLSERNRIRNDQTERIMMKTIEEIQEKLNSDCNLANVAKKTGLSYMTVWRVKEGITTNITLDTLNKFNEYFEGMNYEEI